MRRTLVRFDSARLGRADRGRVRAYIGKVCGFSPAQITRWVRQQAGTGAVEDRRARNSGRAFGRVYTPADVRLLAEMDEAFGALSGLSRSHLYHLRASRTYRMKRTRWEKTRASPVAITVRKAPEPNGRPGFVRVDMVHPGDRDGRKGVYVVHMVDEVTQYEHVGAVPGISERFMAPMLENVAAPVPVRRAGLSRRQLR